MLVPRVRFGFKAQPWNPKPVQELQRIDRSAEVKSLPLIDRPDCFASHSKVLERSRLCDLSRGGVRVNE